MCFNEEHQHVTESFAVLNW